jgi:predicted proteasome-type protease
MEARDVAQWMVEELNRVSFLYQNEVVYEIQSKFGEKFTYINENGNLAISRSVLNEFKKLTKDIVVWDRRERLWRMREAYDDPNKRQAD